MIGALALALLACADAAEFTWRVVPPTPRVGDRVVLEAVLDPSPRGDADVADPGLAPGLVADGEFARRRDGGRLVLSRAYVVAASGAVDLPRTLMRSGDATWLARAAQIDVTLVEPGRRGRAVVDPLQPMHLPEGSSNRSRLLAMLGAALVGLWLVMLVVRRARRGTRQQAVPARPATSTSPLRERLDELSRRFDSGELTPAAAAAALRDVLRDAWSERSHVPARARTSLELDALVRGAATADAAFCAEVFDEVEALCYADHVSLARDRVGAWLRAARAWLHAAGGGA